jgi:hypothetical protein
MKIDLIMAILAFVFGLGGALVAYSWSGLSADLATNGSITLISSILGLIGIYLFEKDYKLAIVQYLICGIGVLIGTSLLGILGLLFYILAAILSYMERDKSGFKSKNYFDDIHFYGDEAEIKQRYTDFPSINSKNTLLWIIPIVTILLILSAGLLGDINYQNDLQNKANSIQITNVTSDLKVDYGYYSGGVQATLVSERDIKNVQIKGVWYAEDGSQIDQTYDSNILNDLTANQKYQLNIPYYKESNYKPVKMVIEVYENIDDTPLYTKTINFN